MSHGHATLTTALAGFGLTWAVQSSALLALGLLAGRVLRRSGPAVQSGVYRTTLLAVLVCPLASALLTAAGYDGLTLRLPAPTTGETPAADPQAVASAPPAPVSASATSNPEALKGVTEPLGQPRSPAEPTRRQPVFSVVSATPQPAPASPWTKEAATAAGLSGWLLGATVMGARLLVGHLRMIRLRASAVPVEPGTEVLCRELAGRIGVKSPAVLRSPFLFSPCLDGLWRPAILLPDDLGENLRETFVHELAHLVRRDGLWNLLRRSSVAALWFQPLLWTLSRRLEGVAEEVCDDYVVQFGADRTRYADHLLELARRALPPAAPAGVGMVSLRSMLARRIVRLLDTSRSLSTRAGTRAVLAMLVVGLAVTLLAGLLVVGGRREAKAQEPAESVETKDGLGRPEDAPAAKAGRADIPITGRVVDLEGRPVSGASVRIVSTAAPKSGTLGIWMAAVRGGETPTTARRHLDFVPEPAADPREVTTDAQGRFQFQGVAPERLVHLAVRGPTIASAMFTAATRPVGPIAARGFRSNSGTGTETIFGADFTFTATPGRLVEGTVRDSRTRRPLAGVEIQSKSVLSSNGAVMPILKTAADELGRFRLTGLPKGIRNILIAVPGEDQSYLTREVAVPDSPGIAPISVDVELHRGLWIEGKVTDKVTGRPIEGARLHYFPFLDNKYAQALPEFHPGGSGIDRTVLQHQYTTKPDGTYRLVGLPGRAIVGVDHGERLPYRFGFGAEAIGGMDARGYFPTWKSPGPPGRPWPLSMKEIDPAEGTEGVRVDLQLDPGASVRVRAIDPQGQPLTGLKVSRRTGMGSLEGVPRAEFDVVALGEREERRVAIWHEGSDLGKVVPIRQGDDKEGPVVVVLEPVATIVGRVLDGDGQPVSGAAIEPRPLPEIDFNLRFPRVTTDKEGRFRAPNVPVGCDYRLWAESGDRTINGVRGSSEAVKVRPGETTDVGDIRLKRGDRPAAKAARPDVPINGRVVDLEGRPIAGVSVKIHDFRVPKSGDLSSWLEGVKRGEPPWIAGKQIDWNREAPAAALREATTDADGRFRLEGLGAERIVELTLQGGTMAATRIEVVTRTMEPIPARGFRNQHGPGFSSIHGADFTFTAAPSRPIEGVLKEAGTARPLANMEVRSYRFAGSDFVGTMTLTTRTDARGRFRLAGMLKGKGNVFVVVPDDEQPYLVQEVDVPDPPGVDPVSVEVSLPRGIWIEGRLTEKATGTPVPGAWLHYMPFLENTFAQAHPAFDRHGNGDNSDIQDRYLTKADGSFRLVGLPGRAIVGALVHKKAYLQGVGSEAIAGLNKSGHFETYRSPINPGRLWPTVMKEINPAVDADVVRVDLQVTTGLSVRLRVVDAEDNPVTGASTRGLTGRSSYESENMTGADGDVTNLRPDEERIVVVRHPGRKIGKAMKVRKGDDADGPVVARLEPLAVMTGRVVDADGNPVPGATVRPDLLPSGDFSLSLPQVATDEQGRFLIPEVPAGCDYGLVAEGPGGIKVRRVAFLMKATVNAGETTDVGEIRFKND